MARLLGDVLGIMSILGFNQEPIQLLLGVDRAVVGPAPEVHDERDSRRRVDLKTFPKSRIEEYGFKGRREADEQPAIFDVHFDRSAGD